MYPLVKERIYDKYSPCLSDPKVSNGSRQNANLRSGFVRAILISLKKGYTWSCHIWLLDGTVRVSQQWHFLLYIFFASVGNFSWRLGNTLLVIASQVCCKGYNLY